MNQLGDYRRGDQVEFLHQGEWRRCTVKAVNNHKASGGVQVILTGIGRGAATRSTIDPSKLRRADPA